MRACAAAIGEILERGGDLVVGGIEAEHAETALQVEHLLLRGFDLVLEVVELAGEPLGDALGGEVAASRRSAGCSRRRSC